MPLPSLRRRCPDKAQVRGAGDSGARNSKVFICHAEPFSKLGINSVKGLGMGEVNAPPQILRPRRLAQHDNWKSAQGRYGWLSMTSGNPHRAAAIDLSRASPYHAVTDFHCRRCTLASAKKLYLAILYCQD